MMKNLLLISALAAFFAGCAAAVKDGEQYFSGDYYLQREAELQKAYDACLKRTGNNKAQCAKEKDELLQQQEWNEMEESG